MGLPGEARSSQPFIAVHFPKAAGTSLLAQLDAQLGDRLERDYDHRPLGPRAHDIADGLPAGKTSVYGHFRPGRYDAIRDVVRFTILREPVDALISTYFYWQTIGPHGNLVHDRFQLEQPTIEAFARYPGIHRLMSETYFGGYDMRRFDFIGFYDTRAHDLHRLGALLGLDLRPDVTLNRAEQVAVERTELQNDAKRLRALADILAEDVRFYEQVRAQRGPSA
jgi:hypothetical protein